MGVCGSCWGSGRIRCSSCSGRGYISRLTSSGEMDTSPCAVCGGRREIRCSFCGGSGQVGTPSTEQSSRPRRRSSDPLEGRWSMAGGWYEFYREGDEYRVVAGGPTGLTDEGSATRDGNLVRLHIRSTFLGDYTLELQLSGNTLQGTINVMGMPVRAVFQRQ